MHPGLRAALLGRGPLSLKNYGPGNALYIAHRGAGLLYPEYSVASYDAAYNAGLRVLEQDVQLLSDGGLAVIHDATVDRTTTASGNVADLDAAGFTALTVDAGTWFGGGYGNLTPPLAPAVFSRYRGRVILVPEAKGAGVVAAPVCAALAAAGVPRDQALVNVADGAQVPDIVSAGYPAMGTVASTDAATEATLRAYLQAQGATWATADKALSDSIVTSWCATFKTIMFTVDRRWERDYYLALGAVGFYCNDPAYVSSNAPLYTTDPFGSQAWSPGMIPATDYDLTAVGRGRFSAPDYWGFSDTGGSKFVLMGWACPIKGNPAADTFTIDLKVTFNTGTGDPTSDRWGAIWMASAAMGDRAYADAGAATENGYLFIFRKNGTVNIFRRVNGTGTTLSTQTGTAITDGTEVGYRVTVTPSALTVARLNGDGSVNYSATSNDTTHRGGYWHLGHNGLACLFRRITIA